MLSSLVSVSPTSEYDLWVREMTVARLDFRNPVGAETFNCFKRVCIIKKNTIEISRSDPSSKEVQNGKKERKKKRRKKGDEVQL